MPRGGKRLGAGRKKARFRVEAPHRSREEFTRWAPVHVTMRSRKWLEMRNDAVFHAVAGVLARYREGETFRVVHISIQENHLHLIVEAANSTELERMMRSLTIRIARAVAATINFRGKLFFRYHSTVIKNARYARHVIAYVLGNWRRHNAHIENGRFLTASLDRFSSAISFTGWTKRFAIPKGYTPLPVSLPTTMLLRSGWAFNGPLDPHHVPGPPR